MLASAELLQVFTSLTEAKLCSFVLQHLTVGINSFGQEEGGISQVQRFAGVLL